MLTKQEIRRYYEKAHLVLKPETQWRLYKLQLYDGKWSNIKNQIRNVEQLRKVLIKTTPINVFSSTSSWLNPLNTENRSYRGSVNRILLDNLVFIDIDKHDPTILNHIVDYFKNNPRYKFWKAKDSGNGYGVYYEDTKKIPIKDPRKRVRWLKIERIKLVMDMVDKGISDFDWRMIIDPFRVSRVIGTLNEGEKICKEINVPLVRTEESPERSEKTDEREEKIVPNPPITEYRKSALTGLGSSSYYFYVFIDSQIHGIKEKHCVFIAKRKEFGYPRFVKLLKKLQSMYRLSDFYIFETAKQYTALCVKGVHEKRYLRILRQAKAANLNSFVKYRHSWIRTGQIIDNNNTKVDEPPVFKDVLENNEYQDHFHSNPHIDYLKKIGAPVKEYVNRFGTRNSQPIARIRV